MANLHIHESTPGSVPDVAAVAQFQKDWATYQKLVDNDYLSHRAAGALLHEALAAVAEPFAFLDIACGDAGIARQALEGTAVRRYRGIDIALPAIRRAAAKLRRMPFEVDLDHGDFVETLRDRPEPADIAWCGLSIHHLETDAKRDFLKSVRASTARFMMIYEPACREGESRDGWVERFLTGNEKTWTALTTEEKGRIANHVTTADLPETVSGWKEIAIDAGFATAADIYTDPSDTIRMFRFDV